MAPTYILAPNFTYHPNTSICMGDIVEYPDDPTKPLSSVPEPELKHTTRHFDYDNEFGNQSILSLRGSIWAKFIEKANAKIGSGTSDELLTKYTIRRLETVYFTKQPTDEEAAKRIKEKRVKAAVNAGLLMKKPVFMITGLKIARGFQSSTNINSTVNADVKVEAPVPPDAGMGSGVGYSREERAMENHRTGQDIIFAYQLHIITHRRKGLKLQKDVDIRLFKTPAAFLATDEEGGEEDSVAVAVATASILRDFDKEIELEVIGVDDSGEESVCLVSGDA
ncbi:hypothetical protein V8C43DRAFT_277976 [Trichoderma afarasin]